MVDLFHSHSLVKNNKDPDELDTEWEIVLRLQNRVHTCEKCQQFVPLLKDFHKHLTDEFYVERSALLVLLYIR